MRETVEAQVAARRRQAADPKATAWALVNLFLLVVVGLGFVALAASLLGLIWLGQVVFS